MFHAILCLLPALALTLPLLARRYPGERVLLALRAERRSQWPRPRSSALDARRTHVTVVRGGLLLGRALAVRPPPASLSVTS
ncbi:MAG: hypothetical protein ACHQDY_01095 [Solirubrobacterales bacterium]